MVSKYRSVLSVPGSPGLMLSALVGRMPLGMSSLAILLLVRGTHHSYTIAGVSVGAYAFASAGSAPIQGRLIDRFGRMRVMIPMAVAQAIVLVGFVLASSADASGATLVPLAALAGGLMPPVSPTARALWRDVFTDPQVRDTAYALDSVVQEVAWVTGPLIVALVVGFTSPEVAVLLVATMCVIGTTLFVRSPLARGSGTRSAHEPRTSVLANHELRAMLAPIALTGVGIGAIEVGLPALALHAGSRPASGLLLALWSLGSMVGGLWYGARAWSSSLTHRYRLFLFGAIICTAPLIIARSIPEGIVASLLAGLMIAPDVLVSVRAGGARRPERGRRPRPSHGSRRHWSPDSRSGRRSPAPRSAWPASARRSCSRAWRRRWPRRSSLRTRELVPALQSSAS